MININWNNIRHINVTRIAGYFLSRLSSPGKNLATKTNTYVRCKMSFEMSFGDIVLAGKDPESSKSWILLPYLLVYHPCFAHSTLPDLLRTEGCPGRSNQEAECFHFKVKSVKT